MSVKLENYVSKSEKVLGAGEDRWYTFFTIIYFFPLGTQSSIWCHLLKPPQDQERQLGKLIHSVQTLPTQKLSKKQKGK